MTVPFHSQLRRLFPLLLLACLLFQPALAQTASPTPTPGNSSVTKLKMKLAEVEAKLENAPSGFSARDAIKPGAPPSYVDSLRRYEVTLRRMITLTEDEARLKSELDSLIEELGTVAAQGLSEPKPYSVKFLDRLQSDKDLIVEKSKASQLAYTAAKTSRELESSQLQQYEALRRRLLDKLASTPNDVELKRQLENTEIAIEASQAGVKLADQEMDSAQLEIDISSKRAELVQLKLNIVEESFHFSSSTLQTQIDELEQKRDSLHDTLQRYKSSSQASEEKLESLYQDAIEDSQQKEEIEARQEWTRTHQRKERLLEERLEFNLVRRDLWKRRFLAHTGKATENFKEWEDSARGLLVRLSKNRDLLNSELRQIRAQLSDLLSTDEEPNQKVSRWREVKAQALVNRQKALEEALSYHLETESLAKRLLAELQQRDSNTTFRERVSEGWAALRNFWNVELYTLGDSSVTVGKLAVAITVLVLGLTFVGRITHFLSLKLFAVLPLKESAKVNLERIFRYLLTLLVFLFSLHVVNIPLTIFTFLGGTLAIAVGFGAQNILNNFISGLILMVERPVRVGDLIEVDDTIGTVEEIGARSTRVRVPSGIHVILPNSSLLENRVVNWTLQDNRIRTKVQVGVAYGSPTRQVVELINKAVTDEKEVLPFPVPVVTFDEFADSSLNFTVHFWVSVSSPLDLDRIGTKVRLHIDDLFREHGITIPFPQRDLNFSEPVPVRIIDNEDKNDT